MTVEVVAAVLGCLLLVALAYLVGRLHGEVRNLKSDLESNNTAHRAVAVDEPLSAGAPTAVAAALPTQRTESIEIPVITAMVGRSDNVDLNVSRVASVTLARPLIKVAAFSYGLRRAFDDERRFRIRYAMRLELTRQRKMRRRRRAGWAPSTRSRS
jgi:hypothetical protein